jgi:hypothetical protein
MIRQPEKYGMSSEVTFIVSLANLFLLSFAYIAVAAWIAPKGTIRTAIVMAVLLMPVNWYR